MPKIKTLKSIIILLVLIFSTILMYEVNSKYNIFYRVDAWISLKYDTYSNYEEAYQDLIILTDGEDKSAREMVQYASNLGIDFQISEVEKFNSIIAPTESEDIDVNFLNNYSYTYPFGKTGIQEITVKKITKDNLDIKIFPENGDILSPPNEPIIYYGKSEEKTIQERLEGLYSELKTKIKKKNKADLQDLISDKDYEKVDKMLSLKDLSYRVDANSDITIKIEEDQPSYIQVGTIKLTQKNCTKSGTINVIYNKAEKRYLFDNTYSALYNLCNKPLPTTTTLSCSNCWLAPVSKNYALKSSYIPYVVATGVNGGGYVTPDTKTALKKLMSAARNTGLTPRVTSSYRSYYIQESLFNSYVTNEMKNGLTYSKAVIKANTYSAKPGHSEHQLGTTVDILNCDYPCSFYDSRNNTLFSFFLQNAYKYGFAISYPDGSQPYTGYVYEPWHLRYIGVNRATKLYNSGYLSKKGYYLYDFLIENREW